MNRRWVWTLGLLSIGACGGRDGDAAGDPPPPPPTPTVTLGTPVSVSVAAVTGGANAETAAVNLTWNVPAAGNYQCVAHGVDGAQGRDAQMAILQGATELQRDDDSGEGFDALINRALTPGAYTVRVWEWQGRAATITVTCANAPAPAPTAGVLVMGTPATVHVAAAEGPAGQADLSFAVPTAGNYRCDATSTMDAQMAILQNGQELERNDDGGEGVNARIIKTLTPGAYVVRVWEWQHRAAAITVTCAPAVAVAAPNGVLTLGAPATVAIPAGDGPAGEVHMNLVITAPGPYTCDAVATGADAQMAIVQAGNVLAQDDDSGEGTNARITHTLAPGAYQVRLWEWQHRAAQITVTCRAG